MLKYIGLLAIFLASVMPAAEYGKRHKRKMIEYQFFIRLADGIYSHISNYLRPLSEFFSEFDYSPLSDIAEVFSAEGDFGAAFSSACKKLSVSARARGELTSFFSSVGTSRREEEIKRAAALKNVLLSEMEAERKSGEVSVGAARAVSCAVGLTFVILLI